MEPTVIESSFSVHAWIGIAVAAVLLGVFIVFMSFDVGAASIDRPRQRHKRSRGVPRKLAEDLAAMAHLSDDDLDYECSTLLHPKVWPAFGVVETNTLPVFGARDVGEIPIWQIQKLLHIGTQDLATSIDLNRWRHVHDYVTGRLHKVALVLNARREALAIAQGDDYVPGWIMADEPDEPIECGPIASTPPVAGHA